MAVFSPQGHEMYPRAPCPRPGLPRASASVSCVVLYVSRIACASLCAQTPAALQQRRHAAAATSPHDRALGARVAALKTAADGVLGGVFASSLPGLPIISTLTGVIATAESTDAPLPTPAEAAATIAASLAGSRSTADLVSLVRGYSTLLTPTAAHLPDLAPPSPGSVSFIGDGDVSHSAALIVLETGVSLLTDAVLASVAASSAALAACRIAGQAAARASSAAAVAAAAALSPADGIDAPSPAAGVGAGAGARAAGRGSVAPGGRGGGGGLDVISTPAASGGGSGVVSQAASLESEVVTPEGTLDAREIATYVATLASLNAPEVAKVMGSRDKADGAWARFAVYCHAVLSVASEELRSIETAADGELMAHARVVATM